MTQDLLFADMTEESRELAALEYLVSAACGFVVELCQEYPGEYHFRPATHEAAHTVGDYPRGERFWEVYGRKTFNSPFEAAVKFVNANRVWERKMQELEDDSVPSAAPLH